MSPPEALAAARRRWLHAAGAVLLGRGLAAWASKGAGPAGVRVIDIVARKFEFVPDEIRIRRGEAVELRFTAPDVVMGFKLDDFQLRRDLVPGQVTRVALTSDRSGTFVFVCDVFCGSGHEQMDGTLVVV